MIAIFGKAKFILKNESTFCKPREHWFSIHDECGVALVSVPMTSGQARQAIERHKLEIISPARFHELINKGRTPVPHDPAAPETVIVWFKNFNMDES